MRLRSLRSALVLLVSGVVLAVAATTALVAWLQLRAVYKDHLDRLLAAMINGAAYAAVLPVERQDSTAELRRILQSPWRGTGVEFRVWSEESGEIAASVGASAEWPVFLAPPDSSRPPSNGETYFDVAHKRKSYHCVWARRTIAGREVELILAHPSAYETRRLREAAWTLSIAVLALVGLGAVLAVLGVDRVLRPVRAAAVAVERASPGRGSADVAPGIDAPTEIRPLVDAVARLLADVRTWVERQERFTADAAHELRTPVALAQSTLQLAASRPRSPEETRAAIDEAVEDLRALERLVERLLALARLDATAELPGRTTLRIDHLVARVATRFAERTSASIRCGPLVAVEVEASEPLLEQLLTNLVDNAHRYGPRGGTIRLDLSLEATGCTVGVEDEGGALPPEALARLFDRFYRGPHPGTRDRSGSGLGLAIARQIARLHGGDITAEVAPGQRTRFIVRLPGVPARA